MFSATLGHFSSASLGPRNRRDRGRLPAHRCLCRAAEPALLAHLLWSPHHHPRFRQNQPEKKRIIISLSFDEFLQKKNSIIIGYSRGKNYYVKVYNFSYLSKQIHSKLDTFSDFFESLEYHFSGRNCRPKTRVLRDLHANCESRALGGHHCCVSLFTFKIKDYSDLSI